MAMNTTTSPQRQCMGPADRDLAMQVTMLRDTIRRKAPMLEPLLAKPGTGNAQPQQPGKCTLFNVAALEDRLASLQHREDRAVENELQRAKKIGPTRMLAMPPGVAAIAHLAASFPHFAAVIELVRQRAALADVSPGRVFALPPILLAGDPGVGKTAFCEALAGVLGLPTRRADMASATAGFVLSGSHSSWASARPGAVWSLLQSPMAAGMLLLDELDKASNGNYPALGPLYTLLEPSSARHFSDECIDLEVDASHVMTVATCNDADRIEAALRSRFTEFVIPAPDSSQMLAIARSVYRTRRQQSAWGEVFPEELNLDAAAELTACTPRQVGGLLEAAVAHAASEQRLTIEPADIQYARTKQQQRKPAARRVGFL